MEKIEKKTSKIKIDCKKMKIKKPNIPIILVMPQKLTKRITAFFVDGTITHTDSNEDDLLQILQGLVGGDICPMRRDTTTISAEARPFTLRKKLYMNDEGRRLGLPENPHFMITNTVLREGAGGMMTMEMFMKNSYKETVPVRGTVVAVGTIPKL
jgi:hypothetical protein